jgi:foldase protein PrsA
MYNKVKIELGMSIKVLLLILLILPFLSGCRVDEADFELTNYIAKTINEFEKKTETELTKESNGVYKIEDALQLIETKGAISSFTILEDSDKYKLFDVEIGMEKDKAELKLSEIYGLETEKNIEADENSITQTYRDKDSELFLSYDIDTQLVTRVSYNHLNIESLLDNEEQTNAGELIALVGDIRVYYNEAMVYLKSAQENYEIDYSKEIWDVDIFGDGYSFDEYIKDEVLKQIIQLKVIRDKANQEGIILTDEERAEASAYADEHFTGLSDADRDNYLVTRELLEKVYSDNILAEKVFETLTIDVDTNVPDINAQQITVQHILVYSTELNEEGDRVSLSLELKNKALDKVNALLDKARTGEDFYTLAETNSEDEIIEYTFGRGEGPERFSDTFEQAAFNLKTGETSSLITTKYGWHIIYCVTDFNEEATIRVKEAVIEDRRTKLFADYYSRWSADYDVVINSEAWDAISLKD